MGKTLLEKTGGRTWGQLSGMEKVGASFDLFLAILKIGFLAALALFLGGYVLWVALT